MIKKTKLKVADIKNALLDNRFRETLPEDLDKDIQKFLQNPGCLCNHPIYRKVMVMAEEQVKKYFPNKFLPDLQEEFDKLSRNNWTVINCKTDELQNKLRKLPPGRKQLDVARYQDQVTVVINELEEIF